jgi:hypothetical protein
MTGWRAGKWVLAALLVPVTVALTATQADASPGCRRHNCTGGHDASRNPNGEVATSNPASRMSAHRRGTAVPPRDGPSARRVAVDPARKSVPEQSDNQRRPNDRVRNASNWHLPTVHRSRPHSTPTRSPRPAERTREGPTGNRFVVPHQPQRTEHPRDRGRSRSGPEGEPSNASGAAKHRDRHPAVQVDVSVLQPGSGSGRVPRGCAASRQSRPTPEVERPIVVSLPHQAPIHTPPAVRAAPRPPPRVTRVTNGSGPGRLAQNADTAGGQQPVDQSQPPLEPIALPMPPLLVPGTPRPVSSTPKRVTPAGPTSPRSTPPATPRTSQSATPASPSTSPTLPAAAARPAVAPAPASSTALAVMLVSLALAVGLVVAVAGWRGGRRS